MKKLFAATLALGTLALASTAPAQAAGLTTLTESFTTVTTSGGGAGLGDDTTLVSDNTWTIVNRSGNSENPNAVGPQTWQQGVIQAFGAQNFEISGEQPINGYALVNFASAQDDFLGSATVDNYLLTPELDLSLGGTFTFWTRTVQGADRSNVLEVLSGSGVDVTAYSLLTSIGDFQDTFGYPGAIGGSNWEQFVVTIAPGGSSTGRLAFRFFSEAEQAGTNGTQAGVVGIDTISFVANTEVIPEPSSVAGTLLVGGLLASRLRRRNAKA